MVFAPGCALMLYKPELAEKLHLVNLLFANETVPKSYEPDEWHKELDNYIEKY